MNRGQLISYLKSIIYPNSENKIDAGKHQDLEEKILQNVLVKDDDIVAGEENSSGSTVFSSDYVKTTYATKTELSDKLSSLYHYVGSVSSFSSLPITPKNCDVYNVLDIGINYAYIGATVDESHAYNSSNWDSLGGVQGLATALQNGLMSKEDFAKLRDLSSGKSISSIAKTSTVGLVDTYTITYTDATTDTFTVTNGAPGSGGDSSSILLNSLLKYEESTNINTSLPAFAYFSGRWFAKTVDEVNCAATINQGSEFYFKVKNTSSISLLIKNISSTGNNPFICISIDGSAFTRYEIGDGSYELPFATGLDLGLHFIRVIVDGLKESDNKWVNGQGFVISSIRISSDGWVCPVRPENIRLLFKGDSITEGINVNGEGAIPENNSGSLSYPKICSDLLNAVNLRDGFGATGICVSGSGGVPKAIETLDYVIAGTNLVMDYPDAIILNYGTNDQGHSTFEADYKTYIDALEKKYAGVPIFIMVPFYQCFRTEILDIVLSNPNLILIDTQGWNLSMTDGYHPSSSGHATAAQKIADILKEKLGGAFFNVRNSNKYIENEALHIVPTVPDVPTVTMDAFIAPTDFDANAQGLNIANIFSNYLDVNKKYIYLVSSTALTTILTASTGRSYVYSENGNAYTTVASGTITWTSGSLQRHVIVIDTTALIVAIFPDSAVWGYVGVNVYGFDYLNNDNTTLKYIHCQDITRITRLGYASFFNIATLQGVITIPSSVDYFGTDIFYGCSGITGIVLPNNLTAIATNMFANCTGLLAVTIPNTVTSIGSGAFYNCQGLTAIAIPNVVTSIGSFAFSNCRNIVSITIPSSVTSIGASAFANCYGLTTVVIPSSVTSYGANLFNGCSALVNVTLPNNLTNIYAGMFIDCQGLANITIPSSVTSIDTQAFYDCWTLTLIDIPASVTNIANEAFYNAHGLIRINSRNATPPTGLGANTFNSVNKTNCILHVPAGSLSAYRAAQYWTDFVSIIEDL